MRTYTRRAAALIVVATLSLAGCGSSDSGGGSDDSDTKADSQTTSAPAPTGGSVTGDGCSFAPPKGWKEPTSQPPGTNFDAFVANAEDKDSFTDNLNVIIDPTIVGLSKDKLEDAVESVLKRVSAKDIQLKDAVELDGEEAVHVESTFSQNGNEYRATQYAVDHAGKGYVLTVGFGTDVSEADRDTVTDAITSSWKWTS